MKKILLVKETKAKETRVALIPGDAEILVKSGFSLIVESDAGKNAGFSDIDYIKAGCEIRHLNSTDYIGYKDLFTDIDVIVRAKRPDITREKLENQVIKSGAIMIGALDPLERGSSHMQEYKNKGIISYSIDQDFSTKYNLPNILSSMSKIAGRLAVLDALNKFDGTAQNIVIIGFGIVGQEAYITSIAKGLNITIIGGESINRIEPNGHLKKVFLNKESALPKQQEIVRQEVLNADIVITSARQANTLAPILLPLNTLEMMKAGTVIVDMALSEGGNVAGSRHDETIMLANGVIITNVSGYPKIMPSEASVEWSHVSLKFVMEMLK